MSAAICKRSYDHLIPESSPSNAPQEMSAVSNTPNSKRCRVLIPPPSPPKQDHTLSFHHKRAKTYHNDVSAIFPTGISSEVDVEQHIIDSVKRRRVLRRKQEEEAGAHGFGHPQGENGMSYAHHHFQQNARCRGAPAPGGELMFTVDQVRSIVDKALRDNEAELSLKYDAILEEKLREQLAQFLKFNEDHLHRKLNDSQYMYMS